MIRIAVFDDDNSSIKQLDSVFEFYAVNRNTEYDVSWFIGIEGLKRIEKYASNLHIAFVSINARKSHEFCKRLCAGNRQRRSRNGDTTDKKEIYHRPHQRIG